MRIAFLTLIVSLIIALGGCNSDETSNKKIKDNDTVNSNEVKMQNEQVQKKVEKSIVYTKYNLPLPVELYEFLRENKLIFNEEILLELSSIENFNTSVSKAIALGYLSSDLAYCTIFEQNQVSVEYYAATKRFADELNLNVGYSEATVEQFNSNIDSFDSLRSLATNSYWKTCTYLEENNNVNILPFIIYANWIESMYLTIYTYDIDVPPMEAMTKIAQQKYASQNLHKYIHQTMIDLKVFDVNKDIQRISRELESLNKIYEEINKNEKIQITEFQYIDIAKKIKKIRNSYIN